MSGKHASLLSVVVIALIIALHVKGLFSTSLYSYIIGISNETIIIVDGSSSAEVKERDPKTSTAPLAEEISSRTKNTFTNDPHSSHIALLEWQPWERPGPIEDRVYPSHIPRTCSIGTISNGGSLVPQANCGSSSSAYQRVQDMAHALLSVSLSVSSSSSSSSFSSKPKAKNANEDIIACDVCRIMNLAWHRNLSLAFWGDSVHEQNFQGLICELFRRNFTVIERENLDMGLPYCKGINCLRRQRTYIVTSPLWTISKLINSNVLLYYFKQYKPRITVDEFYNTSLSRILAVQPDVLVFNIGLHYKWNARSRHETAMAVILDALKRFGRDQISLLAYRETTAQHFTSPWGEYGIKRGGIKECAPLSPRNGTVTFGWRDTDTRQYALERGFTVIDADPSEEGRVAPLLTETKNSKNTTELIWIPFRNFSGQLHDLHLNECTHFCHTPFLWYPLWRSLRLAMERQFAL